MKTIRILIGLAFFALGCNNNPQENAKSENSDTLVSTKNKKTEGSLIYDATWAIWEYQFDSIARDFKPVKLRQFDSDTLTIEGLEIIVNKTWPKVQIKFLKASKDTVYISIPDSEVLTQQMGTTGADEFMISTTFSFTELKGIKYVSFAFDQGDHATPGVYNRNSWDKK